MSGYGTIKERKVFGMGKKGFMKLAAAAAVAAVCFWLPIKADAAELIHSDEYGDVYVVDSEGRESLVFMEDASGKVLQFMMESAGDPYFVRYNVMDASLAKLKATASAILVLDDNGDLIASKGAAEIQQEVAAHLAMINALDAMDPQQQIFLENQQLVSLAALKQELQLQKQDSLLKMQQAEANGSTEEVVACQFAAAMCDQLITLSTSKEQAVLLYQQQSIPEAQQVLESIKQQTGIIQREMEDFAVQFKQLLVQEIVNELMNLP